MMGTHKDLDVWKESIQFVKEIYAASARLPKEEVYGLTAQMRRAAVSIPTNISEGAARQSKKEYVQFLYIALGSISELETLLIISGQLNFMMTDELLKRVENLRRKLLNLIKYLKRK